MTMNDDPWTMIDDDKTDDDKTDDD